MIKFLLIRHGFSLANEQSVFAGHTDMPLTKIGIMQGEKTCEYLYNNYKIDYLFSSDLSRAYDTILPLAKKINKSVIRLTDFNEIYGGDWEKVSYEQIALTYAKDYFVWKNDVGNSKCTNGESFLQLSERGYSALINLAKKLPDSCTVAIATHAGLLRALKCKLLNLLPNEMQSIGWVSNGSVTTVEYQNGMLNMTCYGYDDHLLDIKSKLPEFK
ncbi:MAG: histidine phosphatase family protein [Clostridia bacterium]|nr:histidine phosphatase family protein [Clostridia bacterium]